MDDLNQQLQKILSDPQAMGQIQSLLGSLGTSQEASSPAPAQPAPGPDLSSLLGALGGDPLPVGLLAERTGMPVGALFGLLTRLEMEDKIVSLPGKRYRRA